MRTTVTPKTSDQNQPLPNDQKVPQGAKNNNTTMKTQADRSEILGNRIDQHRSKIDQEMPLLEEASAKINEFTVDKLAEMFPVLIQSDEEYCQKALADIQEYAYDTSHDVGYVWACQHPSNEFLSVLLDAWFAAFSNDVDCDYVLSSVFNNRWPDIVLNWAAFFQGVSDLLDQSLEDLTKYEA
jgi:hypothetical protein